MEQDRGDNGVQDNKQPIKSAGYNNSGSYVCLATNVLGKYIEDSEAFRGR